ncbi:hypothetical protein WDU94_008166 [Cyamophila willieti]
MFKVCHFLFALSLINCALAIWNWGPCPSAKLSPQFHENRFAGSVWYEYKRSSEPKWEAGTECNKLYFNGVDSVSKLIFRRPDGVDQILIKVDRPSEGLNNGKMIWEFQFKNSPVKENVQVLATDYYTYALLWSCHNYYLFHTEWAQLWSSSKYYNHNYTDWKVEPVIKLMDSQHKFKPVNQFNCTSI